MMEERIILDIAKANNQNENSFFKNTKITYLEFLSFLNTYDQNIKGEILFNLNSLLKKSLDEVNNYLYLLALGAQKIKEEGK